MFEINGYTKQLGIIGYPVEHTFSPNMHNFISETVHNNYVYGAWCVKPEDLKDAINGMRALGISGINVTAPHKVEVMKYIDVVTDGAKKLGSVNTVVNRDGKLYGYNTDADGFCMALTKAGIEIENSRILIIGAGGAARAIAFLCAGKKASELYIMNRTLEKAQNIADAVNEYAKKEGSELNAVKEVLAYEVTKLIHGEEEAEKAIVRYRERYIPIGVYECELFEGVRETIQAFKEAGYIQVITSSKPEAQCRQVLEKFDLLTELDEVVGASHDGRIDTKIEVLQEAFRRMKAQYADFSKEQTVLIGDTHYDADGAKEGGIDCIGVGYGFGGAEEMWNAGAVAVYEDQKALREALV